MRTKWRVRKAHDIFGFDPAYLVEFKNWYDFYWRAYNHYEYPTRHAAEFAMKRAMATKKK